MEQDGREDTNDPAQKHTIQDNSTSRQQPQPGLSQHPMPEIAAHNEQRNINTGGGDYSTRDIYKPQFWTFIYGDRQERTISVPRQVPQPPSHYVARPAAEQKLQQALADANAPPVTLLYGLSGTGKSSLAAHVVERLAGRFPGVLWGNLDKYTANEQLLHFLGCLDVAWYQRIQHDNTGLRDLFWKEISAVSQPVLIVFDNVKNAQQLAELLPDDDHKPGHCRILIISFNRLAPVSLHYQALNLTVLTLAETKALFCQLMGNEAFDRNKDILLDISRRLDYFPHLLVTIAKDFHSGRLTPFAYLQALRNGENQNQLIGDSLWDGLDLIVRELSAEQRDLFEFISVLGEGDWHDTMLAAVALCQSGDIRHDLAALVERELVRVAGSDRYTVNTFMREYAHHRFAQRSRYEQHAAYSLLARYCLDLVQDLDAELTAQSDLRPSPRQPISRLDEAFILAFQTRLRPEMSHIRHVLQWAAEQQEWDLLRRFAYKPYAELLKDFVANAFEVRFSFTMGTLYAPLVCLQGQQQMACFRSLLNTTGYIISARTTNTLEQHSLAYGQLFLQDKPPHQDECCEMNLEITAGHIIDGVFNTARLIDVTWTGVRARGLICKNVDLVSGRFIACDLSHSIWVDCDARGAFLGQANVSYALLKNVQLRSADVSAADLTSTVLEEVDLRGADLRGAVLIGAVLEEVDLRGADLRGADFSGAVLHKLRLAGSLLTDVRWNGSHLQDRDLDIEDTLLRQQIVHAAQTTVDPMIHVPEPRTRPVQQIRDQKRKDFAGTDLRGVNLKECILTRNNLRRADLRAACLAKAKLDGANLSQALLQAADLTNAHLPAADLQGSNLHAAVLSHAQMEKVNAQGATMRKAYLADAQLPGANLQRAILYACTLSAADLRGADLTDADLSLADLTGAQLQGATLHRTKLYGANLSGANLTGADLSEALCSNADFRNAVVNNAQLAQTAQLAGATLPEGQQVLIFKGAGEYAATRTDSFLRFAQFDEEFIGINLAGRDLVGSQLTGTFIRVDCVDAHLSHARLSGDFANVNFTRANLSSAVLSGNFFEADFTAADFSAASLKGASFVNVTLTHASVTDDQLKQAARLRGTKLRDGERYAGQFDLPGDQQDAHETGWNLNDPADREAFYGFDSLPYKNAEQ